jgi:tripartite-type tricarboxylate transporter receptor subunit TctC
MLTGLDPPGKRTMIMRKSVAAIALLSTVMAVSAVDPGAAQNWPTRAVSAVSPFAPGSSSDTLGRILAVRMSEFLGQQVIVENSSGAGGMTGSLRVVNAPPDGYMFSIASTDTIAINQSLYKKPLYNSLTDFTPVGLVAEQPVVLIVRTDFPVNTLQEFISYVKANLAKVTFGSSGVGSASHLACARLNAAMGVTPTHVPYRGSAPAMQDMAGGRIDYFCALGGAAVPPIEAKIAKGIALLTKDRSPLFPTLTTAREQGLNGVESYFWTAFMYPKGTPEPVVQRLNAATSDAIDTPLIRDRLRTAGVIVVPPERRSPAYLKTFVENEVAEWGRLIKASGVSVD